MIVLWVILYSPRAENLWTDRFEGIKRNVWISYNYTHWSGIIIKRKETKVRCSSFPFFKEYLQTYLKPIFKMDAFIHFLNDTTFSAVPSCINYVHKFMSSRVLLSFKLTTFLCFLFCVVYFFSLSPPLSHREAYDQSLVNIWPLLVSHYGKCLDSLRKKSAHVMNMFYLSLN